MCDMSSFYDAHLCHTIFKSHHRQLSHGPETNMLQVRSVTLTVATRILRVTRLLVMMINCTKQYLYSTIKNKVMVQTQFALKSACNLDLKGSDRKFFRGHVILL